MEHVARHAGAELLAPYFDGALDTDEHPLCRLPGDEEQPARLELDPFGVRGNPRQLIGAQVSEDLSRAQRFGLDAGALRGGDRRDTRGRRLERFGSHGHG